MRSETIVTHALRVSRKPCACGNEVPSFAAKKWPARSLHRAGFAMAYTIPFETDAPAEHCDAAE
jgi:hypothetical protein